MLVFTENQTASMVEAVASQRYLREGMIPRIHDHPLVQASG